MFTCLPVSVYLFGFGAFRFVRKLSDALLLSSNTILFVFSLHPPPPSLFCPTATCFLSNKVRTKCPQVSRHLVQCHRLVGTLSDLYCDPILRQAWQPHTLTCTHKNMHAHTHTNASELLFNSVIVSLRLHKQTRNALLICPQCVGLFKHSAISV